MACDEEKDIYMVSPTYMLPTALNGHYYNAGKLVHGAAIHLAADGERWLGELFGKVIRKVIVGNERWQPLRPVKAWYDKIDQSIVITFHVPAPPIVTDTAFLPAQGKGLGFEIYDLHNHLYRVKKVYAEGNDRIRILLTDPLTKDAAVFVRYGLTSYVSEISEPIKEVHTGIENVNNVEIIFEGNVTDQFAVLLKEGVFYLGSRTDSGRFQNLIVRGVSINKDGNTVLKGEKDDAVKDPSFNPGQKCFISRVYAYGNIHDSDTERSTFNFHDGSYGRRFGQSYPLYNWCIVFRDLKIYNH